MTWRATSAWPYGEEGADERAFTEEHARDSYENVLFSIARFKDLTGHLPRNVTVVGRGCPLVHLSAQPTPLLSLAYTRALVGSIWAVCVTETAQRTPQKELL